MLSRVVRQWVLARTDREISWVPSVIIGSGVTTIAAGETREFPRALSEPGRLDPNRLALSPPCRIAVDHSVRFLVGLAGSVLATFGHVRGICAPYPPVTRDTVDRSAISGARFSARAVCAEAAAGLVIGEDEE